MHAYPYRAVGCAQYLRSNGAIEEPVQNRHAPGRYENQIHLLGSCRVENHGSRRTLTMILALAVPCIPVITSRTSLAASPSGQPFWRV